MYDKNILDANNQKVDIANVSGSGNYDVGLTIDSGSADEFATPDVKAQFSVLSPEDRQYLIDYEYAMSVVNAMRGQDDKGPYSDGDLRAVFTYQGDQTSD